MVFQGILGVLFLLLAAWGLSENRARVNWRLAGVALGIQLALALVLLGIEAVSAGFVYLNRAVLALQEATEAGTSFVFGYLGGGEVPFEVTNAGAMSLLAFQALPLVLVIAALSAVLWHWRVLPVIVRGFAWALRRTFGVGGAVGVSSAANIFVGMVESPLLVKPYIARLTRAELFVVMTVGMATIAGTVLVLYATTIATVLDNAVAHLLIASVISAPAGIMFAHIMVPEAPGAEKTEGEPDLEYTSTMEAVTRGTSEGLNLYLNIIAMLIVVVALVSLVNIMLALFPDVLGEAVTLQRILGAVMAPYVWLLGVPWSEAVTAGQLMGTKTVLNEFLAYLDLAALPGESLSPRSTLIMTYALCGFANFQSLGIMLAGLITMAPERRSEIAGLGLKSIVSGTFATSLTGAIVGLI